MEILGTAILIKPDKLPERTDTGMLVIPKNSREMLPEWGIVADCGRACEVVKKGDYINFPRKKATVIVIDDMDYYLCTEHQIFYTQEKLKNQK